MLKCAALVLAILVARPLPLRAAEPPGRFDETEGRLDAKVAVIEEAAPALLEEHNVPGVAVAVLQEGRLAWSRGFGVRTAGSPSEMTADTVMEACSMSKPFFAYVFLQLVEENRFALDHPLVEYLDDGYLEDERRGLITARKALSHTTGLPNWREGGWRSGSPLSLRFEPGADFRYSGEGFLMLQRAVEKQMATDLATLAGDRLIEPLGLRRTGFVWRDTWRRDAASGHDRKGRVKSRRKRYQQPNSAYTLYTTVDEYAAFLAEIMKDDRSASWSLSDAMVAQMLTPHSRRNDQSADWGLGWGLRELDCQRLVYHSGSNRTGFRCYSEFVPETSEGLVIMTNGVNGKAVWQALVERLR